MKTVSSTGCSGVGAGTRALTPTRRVFGRGMGQDFLSCLAELSFPLGSPSLSLYPLAQLAPCFLPQSSPALLFSQPLPLEKRLGGRKHLFFQAFSGHVCWGRKRYPTNSAGCCWAEVGGVCPGLLSALRRDLLSPSLGTKAPSRLFETRSLDLVVAMARVHPSFSPIAHTTNLPASWATAIAGWAWNLGISPPLSPSGCGWWATPDTLTFLALESFFRMRPPGAASLCWKALRPAGSPLLLTFGFSWATLWATEDDNSAWPLLFLHRTFPCEWKVEVSPSGMTPALAPGPWVSSVTVGPRKQHLWGLCLKRDLRTSSHGLTAANWSQHWAQIPSAHPQFNFGW